MTLGINAVDLILNSIAPTIKQVVVSNDWHGRIMRNSPCKFFHDNARAVVTTMGSLFSSTYSVVRPENSEPLQSSSSSSSASASVSDSIQDAMTPDISGSTREESFCMEKFLQFENSELLQSLSSSSSASVSDSIQDAVIPDISSRKRETSVCIEKFLQLTGEPVNLILAFHPIICHNILRNLKKGECDSQNARKITKFVTELDFGSDFKNYDTSLIPTNYTNIKILRISGLASFKVMLFDIAKLKNLQEVVIYDGGHRALDGDPIRSDNCFYIKNDELVFAVKFATVMSALFADIKNIGTLNAQNLLQIPQLLLSLFKVLIDHEFVQIKNMPLADIKNTETHSEQNLFQMQQLVLNLLKAISENPFVQIKNMPLSEITKDALKDFIESYKKYNQRFKIPQVYLDNLGREAQKIVGDLSNQEQLFEMFKFFGLELSMDAADKCIEAIIGTSGIFLLLRPLVEDLKNKCIQPLEDLKNKFEIAS